MTYLLVTNDDGVHAPGIFALAQVMREIGDVSVVAPTINQSATGHKKTLFEDIIVKDTQLNDGMAALSVGGSPADCIALAALGMTDWPPRLVVSGINRGANMGQDVTQSGTVSAALEATIHGVPAVAFSLDNYTADDPEDYAVAAQVAQAVVRNLLDKSLPPFTVMNINIPNVQQVKGIRLTRQGVRTYRDELERDGERCRIVGDPPTGKLDEIGTDLWAVHNGYASMTPIHLDMTAHQFMADVAAWDIAL
jgi:5'-nucleotidase